MTLPSDSEIALRRLARVNGQLLEMVTELYDEQASTWVKPTAPSVKWHLWHMARWADLAQSMLAPVAAGDPDLSHRGDEIWDALGIGDEWDFGDTSLGNQWRTGTTVPNPDSASMPLPETAKVVGYARATFEVLERRFSEIDGTKYRERFVDWHDVESTTGDAMIGYIAHANRHLGMIEAIRGVLGLDGSATG